MLPKCKAVRLLLPILDPVDGLSLQVLSDVRIKAKEEILILYQFLQSKDVLVGKLRVILLEWNESNLGDSIHDFITWITSYFFPVHDYQQE
jgi:hypothetical protein